MKLKTETKKIVDVDDWNDLVEKTYNRPYDFQQQGGCKDRGTFSLTVPIEEPMDFENDSVPEIVNHKEMGVSFKAWLERNPKQSLSQEEHKGAQWATDLWWQRNFYPSIEVVANDLHKKGLIDEGEYVIEIDW